MMYVCIHMYIIYTPYMRTSRFKVTWLAQGYQDVHVRYRGAHTSYRSRYAHALSLFSLFCLLSRIPSILSSLSISLLLSPPAPPPPPAAVPAVLSTLQHAPTLRPQAIGHCAPPASSSSLSLRRSRSVVVDRHVSTHAGTEATPWPRPFIIRTLLRLSSFKAGSVALWVVGVCVSRCECAWGLERGEFIAPGRRRCSR